MNEKQKTVLSQDINAYLTSMAPMYHPTCHNTVALENLDKTDGYTQPLTIFKNFYLLPTER